MNWLTTLWKHCWMPAADLSRPAPIQQFCLLLILLTGMAPAFADGPGDNLADQVRRIPKPGVEVPADMRKSLEEGLATLAGQIEQLKKSADVKQRFVPDVEIFHRAVAQALHHDEFFEAKEFPVAQNLLKVGSRRAEDLLAGKTPWVHAPGLVVRGYRSKIDHTVQPYGLVLPENYAEKSVRPWRLDFWFHGRGETLSEVNFIQQRLTQKGEFTPESTIVLHPYGRYCNANKFAGEIDTFEALEAAKQDYAIDGDRTSVRGFSMGGAACWQFAVHYPDRWFAANPGAGFAETPDFLRVFQAEKVEPSWYEQKLWRWYDCPGYAANLKALPTIAYSGEIDKQKQAADIMAAAMEKEGLTLKHVIGPQTAHKYHPDSKKVVEEQLAAWAEKGLNRLPAEVELVTYTLKYNRMHWLTLDGLGEHWEEARAKAKFAATESNTPAVEVTTKNVTALTLNLPGRLLKDRGVQTSLAVSVNGQNVEGLPAITDRDAHGYWNVALHLEQDRWTVGPLAGLQKKHDLQGPIDDALMDSFIFVLPSGRSKHPAVQKWVEGELAHATEHWRRQMRGDVRTKRDTEITDEDMKSAHLILWGDADSNTLIAKVRKSLPIAWDGEQIAAGEQRFPAADHVLLGVYPNPLSPSRYVVLNSSFTYREYDYLNNARQVAKLPDWAVIDVRQPTTSRSPGKVVAADFFDEHWCLKPPRASK